MTPLIRVVIGKNFGDEGKGLAVDHFSADCPEKTLVIRHNGGAQSGHTVEIRDEDSMKRFIFHELSSGSFRHADTYWAETFFPDLYKLSDELEDFQKVAGFTPEIYCDEHATPVLFDDVLQNMLLEVCRGSGRHGSCGMGINEADLRKKAGFGLTFGEICQMNAEALTERLFEIRKEYGKTRVIEILKETGVTYEALKGDQTLSKLKSGEQSENDLDLRSEQSEQLSDEEIGNIWKYLDLLENEELIRNEAELMLDNAKLIHVVSHPSELLQGYDQVIFETGQGLLLDSEYLTFAPHLTASRTGLTNPLKLLASWGMVPDEVIYVTRSYVTRHGAGPLPYETPKEALGITETDLTNLENEWQGRIRYATHGTPEEFISPVLQDLNMSEGQGERPVKNISLFVTHLNETDGKLLMKAEGAETISEANREICGAEPELFCLTPEPFCVTPEELAKESRFRSIFTGMYLSDGKDQADTKYQAIE